MTKTETTSISITRALTNLKTLSEKIDTAIASGVFVSAAVGEKQRAEAAVSETSARITGSHDRLMGLLKTRTAIKSAIVKSNAVTTVTFRGEQITVADAIERRSNMREVLQRYMNTMNSQLAASMAVVERAELTVRDQVSRAEQTIFGRDGGSDTREAELKMLREAQERIYGGQLVDPSDIKKKLTEIREEITDLDGELDALLSESNARTIIEV